MMKKVLLLLLVIASYGIANAQQPTELPKDFKKFQAAPSNLPALHGSSFNKGGDAYGWYSPLDFISNNFSGTVDDFVNLTFPDSTVQFIADDNTASWIGFHGFGHMFDLRHELWSAVPSPADMNIIPFDQKDSYFWDSVAFRYLYIRHYPDPSVVDTAFVHYYKNAIPDGIETGILLFDNVDTVRFQKPIGYNVNTLSGQAYFDVDTILLTEKDTTTFGSGGWTQAYYTLPVGTTIPRTNSSTLSRNPNSLFGYSVTFRPGHPYNFGDTMESQGTQPIANGINYFGCHTRSIPSPGPGQSALPTPLRSNDYMETSIMLNKSTRYGQTNSTGWDGYMPGLAFFSTQYIDCQVYVTGVSSTSVKEVNDLGYSLGTIYPNPASNGSALNIEYALRDAGVVTIEIFDLMGKKMATVVNNETTEAGTHTATVTTSLAPGVYVYTLKSGDSIINSKKFTVIR
jgi:hypothetical protein